MSETRRSLRITLAFGDALSDLDALEGMARLAAAIDAELNGIFVEDMNLLHLAGLPVARSFSPLGQPLTLQPGDMARHLQRQATATRDALMRTAERMGARWRFATTQGALFAEVRAKMEESEAIAIGLSRRGNTSMRLGPSRRTGPVRPVVALFSGSERARRALTLAAQLAQNSERPLVVYLAPSQTQEAAELERDARSIARNVTVFKTLPRDARLTGIATVLRRDQAVLTVLEADADTTSPDALRILCNDLPGPALLVR